MQHKDDTKIYHNNYFWIFSVICLLQYFAFYDCICISNWRKLAVPSLYDLSCFMHTFFCKLLFFFLFSYWVSTLHNACTIYTWTHYFDADLHRSMSHLYLYEFMWQKRLNSSENLFQKCLQCIFKETLQTFLIVVYLPSERYRYLICWYLFSIYCTNFSCVS